MPAPVTFNLSLAPLPANANQMTPQQWAQAVVDRLTIAPSAPWSSFQNGGSIGTSDVGPILYLGKQWKVWDPGTGAYIDLVVDGGGIIARTITLNAWADQTPGGLSYYDASGHAAVLAPATVPTGPNWVSGTTYVVGNYVTYLGVVYRCILGVSGATPPNADATHWVANSSVTTGDVLTQSSAGLPTWMPLPAPITNTYIEVLLSSDQAFITDGTSIVLNFNTVKASNGVTFDATNHRIPVTAGSVWFFWAAFEILDSATPSTSVDISFEIRPNGTPGIGIGGTTGWSTAIGQTGVPGISGVLPFAADGYVDCIVSATEAAPTAGGLTIVANTSLTRWGGFRLF